jgi:hypothetical protein
MDDHIIPECYIDTILMETLIPPKKTYNHQKGCNKVTENAMLSKQLIDDFAVGILDKDKKPPKYLKEFELLVTEYSVELHKHPSRDHYLILHPIIEKWLISECQQVSLLLNDFNLPGDFNELMKITKTTTSSNDSRFKSLFRALKKSNATGITQLFQWTDYLINSPYNADETLLKQQGNLS